MSTELIAVIMSSTVISVFISSVFSFIQNRKNSNLQYITLERKEWRETIRKISEEISQAECNNIGLCLNKLKVRINAYGNSNNGDVMEDLHIWRLIETTKKASEISMEELEKCKDLLIDSISLLLKYDWDRAKGEVTGNINYILEKLSMLLFVFTYSGMVIYNFGLTKMYTPVYLLTLLFCLIITQKNYSDYIDNYDKNKLKEIKINTLKMILCLFIAAAIMYGEGRPLELTAQNIINSMTSIISIFFIISIPFLIWSVLWGERAGEIMRRRSKYYNAIIKILSRQNELIETLMKFDNDKSD